MAVKLALDRGLLYGDGFFTTMKVVDNKIHRWPLHLERISFSADRLKFYGLDADQIYQEAINFIAKQKETNGVLRLTITRGANPKGHRGYGFPDKPEYQTYLSWSPLNLKSIEALKQGVTLSMCQTPISQNKTLAGIKHLNRLDQVMASEEIAEGCFDSIMQANRFLVSGTKSNLYFYVNNRWLTPKVNKAGVNGTVRRWLLEAQDNVYESKFGDEILQRAEYCLVSNAIVGIIPVTQIETLKSIKHFKIYPELQKIQQEYEEVSVTY